MRAVAVDPDIGEIPMPGHVADHAAGIAAEQAVVAHAGDGEYGAGYAEDGIGGGDGDYEDGYAEGDRGAMGYDAAALAGGHDFVDGVEGGSRSTGGMP